ncbi:MAG: hypothetical protein JWR37_2135, partial [Mycobacterium sp.]|nr:hypothetical protein [Mycobacterium sp.]
MTPMLDFILDLFRNENAAQAFVTDPEGTLANAGLSGVSPSELQSVATSAIPGLALGGGDPISGLQQAVSNQFGLTPTSEQSLGASSAYSSSPTFVADADRGSISNATIEPGGDGGASLAGLVGDGAGLVGDVGAVLGGGFGAGLGGGAEVGGQAGVGAGGGV